MSWKMKYTTLASVVLSMFLHSCMPDDKDIVETSTQDTESTMLSLQITLQSPSTPATRAESHEIAPALDPENFIDINNNDYQITIFDGNGHFLQNFDVTKKWIASDATSTRTYSINLTGPLTVAAGTGEIQVLVLANWKGFNKEQSASYPNMDANTSLASLYTDNTTAQYQFTMPTAANSVSWKPSTTTGDETGIPMFGVSAIVPLSAATAPTDDDKIDGKKVEGKVLNMGKIELLRALSKIEIRRGAELRRRYVLTNVSLSFYNTTGRFIPNVTENPQWNEENIQVKTPSLPQNVQQSISPLTFFLTENDTWRAYVPEMDLRTHRPTLTIDVTDRRLEKSKSFEISLDNPNQPGNLEYLLRNHIYRFVITDVRIPRGDTDRPDYKYDLDVVPYDETQLNPGFGNVSDEVETDGKPYDDSELNPGAGKESDESEVDGKPYDDSELNPSAGKGGDESETDVGSYGDTDLNPTFGKNTSNE